MNILNKQGVCLEFVKIGNGYQGTLKIELFQEDFKAEIISDTSLYVLDYILSRIELVLSKNTFFRFENELEQQDFAKILNYNTVFDENHRVEVLNLVSNYDEKIEYMDIFNSIYFSFIDNRYFFNYYTGIRGDERVDLFDISKQVIDDFINSKQYRVVSIELSIEELKEMTTKIDDLINEINLEVFHYKGSKSNEN